MNRFLLFLGIFTLCTPLFAQRMEVLADRIEFGHDVASFSEGLLRVKKGELWGYMDERGQWAIPPRYRDAADFSEGLAAVKIGEKYGYINQYGELAIPARFAEAQKFHENIAQVVFIRGQRGYITHEGEIAIAPANNYQCLDGEICSNGLVKVQTKNKKFGYVNRQGKMIIRAQFDRAYGFIEGLAAVTINNKVGFIDASGQVVIPTQYDLIKRFDNGYTGVSRNGKWGLVDNRRHTEVIPVRYNDVQSFHQGKAAVMVGNKWGFMDKNGRMVIPAKFCDIAPYNGNRTAVCINGKWGYMDASGELIITPQYTNPNKKKDAFAHGMEVAYVGYKCGIIDERGKFIVQPRYDCIYFSGETPGLAIVMNNGPRRTYQLVKFAQ